MIKTIEKVTINGQNQSFGGYIYNIAYNPSYSDGPSTLVVNFISESGTYIEPVLSVNKGYKIQIGKNISLDFFAVSWKMNKSPGGRTLEVKFIDASFKLDKIFVGLHKQHGIAGQTGACLIIVGKEINPCDANRDGVVDVVDLKYLVDGCDPCPDCGPGRDPLTKCQNINYTQLLDVSYNFKELIDEIKAKGIIVASVPQTNNKYLAQYTGTLRSVLQSWGADYGFNFYWENNKLNFIDSKQKITVNVNPPADILLEQSNSKSLEGTQSRASISRYQRQGDRHPYTCSSSKTTILLPLLLKDLFLPIVDPLGQGWRETYRQDQIDLSCVFSHYSQVLRDSFWWFNQHRITGTHAAVAKLNIPLTGLGDYKILKVMSDAIPNSAHINDLKKLLTKPDLEYFDSHNGYFIVMSGQSQYKDQQYEYEKRLSDEFIGKYFYRPYTPKLCGGQYNQTKNVTLRGEGTVGHLYEAGDNIKNAPIFSYDFHPDSTVGRMITRNIFMSSAEGYTLAYAQPPPTPNQYLNHSIALLEHTPKWFPEVGATGIKTTLDYYGNRIFHEIDAGRADQLRDWFPELFPAVGVGHQEHIKLFICYSGIFVGSRPHGSNHLDVQTTTPQTLPDGQLYPLGLISNACAFVNVQNDLTVLTIETPSQGVSGAGTQQIQGLGGPVTIPTNISYAGYRAIVEQSYEEVVNIPKIQTVLQDGIGSCADNTLSFDVNFRDINDADIKVLNSGAKCIPDSGVILLAHQTFNKGLTYSISDPKEDVTYSIAGIDLPGVGADLIKNGLVGLDISITNDGVVSSYTFSSRPPQPPKLDLVQRLIESNRSPTPTKV